MDNKIILKDMTDTLKRHFGSLVDDVILFGSRTGKNAPPESDYDFLVILNGDYDWKLAREVYDVCFEIDLKYDIITDIKIISLSELKTPRGKQPFIQNAIETGVHL